MTPSTVLRSSLLLLASVALIVGAAVAHGLRTGRWGTDDALKQAGEPLALVPERIGDWDGADFEIPPRELQIADLAGYLARDYTHRPTGQKASVLIVYGRPGAVGAHTPDVCYQGAGYSMADSPVKESPKWAGGSAEFMSALAVKGGATPQALSILWSWSKDLSRWEAPASPRWHFALSPVLYKVYLVRQASPDPKADTDEGREAALYLYAGVLGALK